MRGRGLAGPSPAAPLLVVAVLAMAALVAPSPVAGQGAPTLDRVEELVQAGDHEGARRALEGWWDAAGDRAPRNELQRGLWFRALLTQEGDRAELDYQRLVLEYPGGPYSDLALLRLGHAAHARGNAPEAQAHFDRLLQDYPSSAQRGEAERWLARHRSGGPGPVAVPSGTPPAAPAAGAWSVQLGAFSSPVGARDVAERARALGFQPRLVRTPGTDLVRVRVGQFPAESGARDFLAQVRARGLEATVVGDADRESPAG